MMGQPHLNEPRVPANKRPLSVTIPGILFLVMGTVGVAYHASELMAHNHFNSDVLWVLLVRLLAVIGAIFLFRGHNWARWLLVLWMAFHVVLSIFHSPWQVVVHSVFLAVLIYFLFRPSAAAYFQPSAAQPSKLTDELGK